MQNVLITGADGFIGSHLTELLLEKGYKVRALAQYNSFNYWGWLEDIYPHKRLEIVSGDIRDPRYCKDIMREIDTVYHLAALIAIPYSYAAPDSYVDTNIKGTLNICQAAKELGKVRVIHTSTSEVYGTAKYVPIDENHPKQPQSPYSASKIGADAMAMSFFHSFELPLTIARPFNTYGPRQSARAFIPTVISQMVSGARNIKVGELETTRDFNFVKDTCQGILLLSECDQSIGQEVNIASDTEISMHDVLNKIRKILQVDTSFIQEEQRIRPKGSEVYRLRGDNSRIKDLTGFRPAFHIDEGLELTCAWFSDKQNRNKYKSEIYNL